LPAQIAVGVDLGARGGGDLQQRGAAAPFRMLFEQAAEGFQPFRQALAGIQPVDAEDEVLAVQAGLEPGGGGVGGGVCDFTGLAALAMTPQGK
jgi:hypothetical protein